MFFFYKTLNSKLENNNYYKTLNILRLDCTEKNIFDYRFIHDNCETNNKVLENDFRKNKDKKLKNIAFISNDFSLSRPSGILCKDFFKKLFNLETNLSIFLISKYEIKYPFTECKNFFYNKNDNMIEEYIKQNNIDILIDMQGHMHKNYNNLLSNRLASIQIHFLGYPGTIGLSCIDYLIADKTIIPTESCKFYREKIAYLPNCYQANSESNLIFKKQNNSNIFKFCNFNSHYKFDKKQIFVWIDILKKTPNSVLYLSDDKYRNFISIYASYNNVKNRIIFSKFFQHKKHLERLSNMNLGLDSYRVNGHTTTSDLISSGIPLITYTSESYQNRVSKSILKSLDLEELICYSYSDYIDLAVKIATNKQYYNYLIDKVKNFREKTLFNSTLYTHNFINLLHDIWNHHYKNSTSKNQFSITNFGHNKKNQNYKWNYIPYVKINLSSLDNNFNTYLIKILNCRGQILRDIADNTYDCYLFTTDGLLFKDNPSLKSIFIKSNNYSDGIWSKSIYNDGFIENLDLQQYNSINKDYNLPQILVIFKFNNIDNCNKIIKYILYQSYLNIKLIIYYLNEDLEKLKYIKIKSEEFEYKILSEEKVDEFIKKKNDTYKLIINESNINNILKNYHYIQEEIDSNPNNFMIL